MKKRIIQALLSIALVFTLLAAAAGGGNKGEISSQAVHRIETPDSAGEVYIDDEAVALANDIATTNGDSLASFSEVTQQAFNQVNNLRAGSGLAPLAWSPELLPGARVRAMEASQSFSHTRPDGSDWWTVNSQLLYGENLARGYNNAGEAVNAWMNSPTHKANLMNNAYRTMAISIFPGSDGMWYWAQEFGY